MDDIEFSDLSDDGGDIVIGGGGSSRPGQAAGRPGGPAGLPPRPNTSGEPGDTNVHPAPHHSHIFLTILLASTPASLNHC